MNKMASGLMTVGVAVPPGGHPGGTAFLRKNNEMVLAQLIFDVFKFSKAILMHI